jgi:selenium metabolism protein YedF
MEERIDLRGLTCPEPVLRTKRLLDDQSILKVEALVDDQVCVNNLSRLSRSLKATVTALPKEGYFQVVIERGQSDAQLSRSSEKHGQPAAKPAESSLADSSQKTAEVIFLAKDTFGDGDAEFSKTLLSLFLQSVLETGHQPRAILMANTGVRLMAADSPALKVLQDFKANGCEVLACGLCVEFYGLKDVIAKDQITNMFAIVEYLFAAEKVISP